MRPRALLLAPLVPGETGNGLSMRAGVWLEVLADAYDVDLVVIPLYGSHRSAPNFTRRHASTILIAQPIPIEATKSFELSDDSKRALHELESEADLVVVFRLVLAPLISVQSNMAQTRILDLDDIDWRREQDLGNAELPSILKNSAVQLAHNFDLVTAANELEFESYAKDLKVKAFAPISNIARGPSPKANNSHEPPFDLVFVGTLGYEPNYLGITWFLEEVLPLMDPNVKVGIVGANPPVALTELQNPQVRVFADVDEVTSFYHSAKLAIVPLQSGSGTRTKILEAWSHGLPVVSTTLGAEGIDIKDAGILANSAAEFAAACSIFLKDSGLLRRQGEAGRSRWRSDFSLEHARQQINTAITIARQG